MSACTLSTLCPVSEHFSSRTMRDTAYWAQIFSNDWLGEAPMRMHSRAVASDGSPQWHPDFERWLTTDRKAPARRYSGERLRTTKVMRRLRQVAIREYEVLYRVLVLGERLEETTRWLNERALQHSIPYPPHRPDGPHYVEKDTVALIIAGIAYAKEFW